MTSSGPQAIVLPERRCVGRWLAWLLVTIAAPASATAEVGGTTLGPPGTHLELRADGRLSLRIAQPVPLADLVHEIGALIGAEVVVRRNPGLIDPADLGILPTDEMLARLAGQSSLALRYRGGDIVQIILIGGPADRPQRERPVVERPPPAAPSPELAAPERRAAAIRDIVKLSYRDDAAAAAELERLYLTSDDPRVRGAAIAAIAGSGHEDALALIRHALDDPEPQVRLRAAQALSVAQGADAADRLQAIADNDPDSGVRAGIARLLDPEAAAPEVNEGPHPAAENH